MASPQQQAQAIVWYTEMKSFTTVQRRYWQDYRGDEPDKKTIKTWFNNFLTTGMFTN
jgi:hypothetical protein